MKLSDFMYDLPEERIAQTPVEPRDHSRLMVVHRGDHTVEHRHFYDIIDYLNPGDVLVVLAECSLSSSTIGSVPYREGIFSVWNDPAKFGLFYHAALITRRGDVSPADKKVAVYASAGLTSCCQRAYNNLFEQHRTATVFESTLPEGYDELVADCDAYPMEDKKKFVSDNGQLWRDLNKRIGAVDTPRTKVTYGMLGYEHMTASNAKAKPQSVQLNGMQVTCKTDFGVIALSSLTDAPIEASDNMLLSAIGRAKNTDSIFDGEKMLDAGRQPILAEVIDCRYCITC